MADFFLELESSQVFKQKQRVGGDVFYSEKDETTGRTVSVLSDGLGSGIKANVLATLTTTMAAKCIAGRIGIERTAEVIMKSLPVCRVRKVSYATFIIVDAAPDGTVQVIEYDTPPYLLIKEGVLERPAKQSLVFDGTVPGHNRLQASRFKMDFGDRLVFFSDGVPQSGTGCRQTPLGWEQEAAESWILRRVSQSPGLSARDLSRDVVNRSLQNDIYEAKDDITCAVLFARRPRTLLVVTGAPYEAGRDAELARRVESFQGKVIIAGGTTANIVARELGRTIETDLSRLDPEVPPVGRMEGADLVTEGIITLGKVEEILRRGGKAPERRDNGATELTEHLLNSDHIRFIVGTRINEAHQDPHIPVGLEMRRNTVQRISSLLKEHYLKEVEVSFI